MFGRSKKQTNQTAGDQPRRQAERHKPATVFSYYSNDRRPNSTHSGVVRAPSSAQEDGGRIGRGIRLVMLPTWIATAAIAFSLIFLTLLSTNPRIQIENDSIIARSEVVYRDAVQSILAESISAKTKLTLDTTAVAQKLQAQMPELESVAIAIPLINQRPIVSLVVAEPVMLLVNRQGVAYFIDNEGRALMAEADVLDVDSSGIIRVVDESGLDINPGELVMSKQNVDFITTIVTELKGAGFSVVGISVAAAPNELQLTLADRPFFVRMSTAEQGKQQVGTLLALIKSLDAQGIVPSRYVDLRVAEKAFYQ